MDENISRLVCAVSIHVYSHFQPATIAMVKQLKTCASVFIVDHTQVNFITAFAENICAVQFHHNKVSSIDEVGIVVIWFTVLFSFSLTYNVGILTCRSPHCILTFVSSHLRAVSRWFSFAKSAVRVYSSLVAVRRMLRLSENICRILYHRKGTRQYDVRRSACAFDFVSSLSRLFFLFAPSLSPFLSLSTFSSCSLRFRASCSFSLHLRFPFALRFFPFVESAHTHACSEYDSTSYRLVH